MRARMRVAGWALSDPFQDRGTCPALLTYILPHSCNSPHFPRHTDREHHATPCLLHRASWQATRRPVRCVNGVTREPQQRPTRQSTRQPTHMAPCLRGRYIGTRAQGAVCARATLAMSLHGRPAVHPGAARCRKPLPCPVPDHARDSAFTRTRTGRASHARAAQAAAVGNNKMHQLDAAYAPT
jgi:hypothetical protein